MSKTLIIVGAIALIAVTILITTLFAKKDKDKLTKQYYEQVIAIQEKYHDEAIASANEHLSRDSALMIQIAENQINYIPIKQGQSDIPKKINAIRNDNAAIRGEFAKP